MANKNHSFVNWNMDRNGFLRCDKCREKFNTIVDLAIHQAEHLVISVSFTQICPICDLENQDLEDLLHHFLQHLIEDQLEQAKLIRWMSLQNYKPDHFESKYSGPLKSQTYKEFRIIQPTIGLHNKCMFCCKYFSSDPKVTKEVLEHIFTHLKISSHRVERAALWAEKFFKMKESKSIVKKFHDFVSKTKTLDRSSNLLEKLEISRDRRINTCRYCQVKFSDSSALYSHYVEWHYEQPSKNYNCFICNFKDSNETTFMDHVYKRHIGCACGSKFQRFEKCLEHVRGCLKNCPHCKNKFDLKGLISHLTKGLPVGECPFCQQKMKSDQLRVHLSSCPSRAVIGVPCPMCRKSTFVEKQKLEQHLIHECRISNSREEPLCLNGSRKISQIPEGNNLLKFNDIKIYLPETETMREYFS